MKNKNGSGLNAHDLQKEKQLNYKTAIKLKFLKVYDDFFEKFSEFLFLPISPIIFENKFYLAYLDENKVHLYKLGRTFYLVTLIPLDDLKKINYIGKYSIFLKFFQKLENGENKGIKIKLLSSHHREVIVDTILPETSKNKINYEKKSVLYDIIGKDKNYLNEYRLRLIEKLKKSSILYNNTIYDILHPLHPKSSTPRDLFHVMLLVFSESSLIKKVFNVLFFNINYIKYDTSDIEEMYNDFLINFRTHRDSISVEINSRKENPRQSRRLKQREEDSLAIVKTDPETEINFKTSSESEKDRKDSSVNNSVDSIIEEFNQKVRPRHKNNVEMRTKSNYIKQFSHRNSLNNNNSSNSIVVGKAEFDKITFNITIPKYFGKDHKILEINKNGFFMIYKKEKVSETITLILYFI